MTLGEEGVACFDKDGLWEVKAPKINVVDTSGAGDVFCVAFAVGLVRGKNYRQASDWACRTAARSVTRPGTIPYFPTLAEVSD